MNRPRVPGAPAHNRIGYTAAARALVPAALAVLLAAGAGGLIRRARAGLTVPGVSGAAAAVPAPVIRQMVDAVSVARLVHHVCKLQDDDAGEYCNPHGSRETAGAGIGEARNYLSATFTQLGLSWHYQDFTLNGAVHQNVVAELPGVDPASDQVVVVSAHYDSRGSGGYAPGADDDASGTAAVLEIADVLKSYRFRHTLRFVLFAGEEDGMIGSAAYAAAVQGSHIRGLIQLDMIAYDSGAPHVVETHARDADDDELAGRFAAAIYDYGLNLTDADNPIGLEPVAINPGISGSDHSQFWANYPAILVIIDYPVGSTQDWDPDYHTLRDQLCKTSNPGNLTEPCQEYRLNLPYFHRVTQAALASLAQLAEPVDMPNLSIAKSGPSIGRPGEPLTYTLAYSNTGTFNATGVSITDSLPADLAYVSDNSGLAAVVLPGVIRWTVGEVAPGISQSFVVTGSVTAAAGPGWAITNSVSIAGVGEESSAADNEAQAWSWLCRRPAGDADGDGTITTADFARAAVAWGERSADGAFDLDGDGDVDIRDVEMLAGTWGSSCAE